MMNSKDIRAMSGPELEAAIESARQEMFNLRFRMASGQQSDTSRTSIVRRDLARLLTVRRERRLGIRRAATTGK
jgi:large subunit ribosomal protein L29